MEQLLWRLKNGELPPIVPPKVIVIACGTNSKGMVSGRLSCSPCLGGKCCLWSLWKVQTSVLACLPIDHHRSVTEELLNRKLSYIC